VTIDDPLDRLGSCHNLDGECCPAGFTWMGVYTSFAVVCLEDEPSSRAVVLVQDSVDGDDCWRDDVDPSVCCPPAFEPVGFRQENVVCLEKLSDG